MDNPRDEAPDSKIATLTGKEPAGAGPHPSLGAAISLAGHYRVWEPQNHVAHHHHGHELIVWRSGQVEVLLGSDGQQEVVTVSPGMVTLWPGQLLHADRALSAYSHVYLIFEDNLALPGLEQPLSLYDDEASSVEHLVLSIEREFNGDRPDRGRMLTLQLEQLALMLRRLQSRAPDSAERLVQRLERLIEERYAETPTITALASELNTSTSHLRAQFSRLRGLSPKAYLRQVRLRHALGYIRTSSLTLEEIALQTGYTSTGHLWHDVRSLTGRTPGSFRTSPPAGQDAPPG